MTCDDQSTLFEEAFQLAQPFGRNTRLGVWRCPTCSADTTFIARGHF